jgi:phosphatidylglycerophosphatase A
LKSEPQSDSLTLKGCFRKANASGKMVLVLSSWFGLGFLPGAPGTFATLGALPLVAVMNRQGVLYGALSLLAFIMVALWVSERARKFLLQDDPREIVIDEVAGLLVTFFLLPLSWLSLPLGFVLFRVFDITKPFPIRRLEKIRGGAGILLDDILAGIYANLSLRILLFIFL